MKNQLAFILLLAGFNICLGQEQNYSEYSYTEFFEMIEEEKDTVFKLNDALIIFDEKTDQKFSFRINTNTKKVFDVDTMARVVVDKNIELDNVQFQCRRVNKIDESTYFVNGGLYNIYFKKGLNIRNSVSLFIYNCVFDGYFQNTNFQVCSLSKNYLLSKVLNTGIEICNSTFRDRFVLTKNCSDKNLTLDFDVEISNNSFINLSTPNDFRNHYFTIYLLQNRRVVFSNNEIQTSAEVFLSFGETSDIRLNNNEFSFRNMIFNVIDQKGSVEVQDNLFNDAVRLKVDGLKSQDQIDWIQFKNKLSSADAKSNLITRLLENGEKRSYLYSTEFNNKYKDSIRFYDKTVYGNEVALLGTFYKYYKDKYNTEVANEVYLELKDFETKRLKVIHDQNPSFRSYFKWKVNQFLKIFSDYGTEPSKAIVFSVYVILLFAFIYLLFPNSWDRHGKYRLIDRYNFFFKYMKRKAGIQEVYLEDQQGDLMTYEQFKKNIFSARQQVPKFFTATAYPLYKWSISGTKLSAAILKRVDIMRGSWNELPKSKRVWKSFLLIGAFVVAIIYDLFIKMLNALMLSINTFTTLGFGEIPIKGLPRYLAIIQGFIGWFMLTIFSVSLISQLLN